MECYWVWPHLLEQPSGTILELNAIVGVSMSDFNFKASLLMSFTSGHFFTQEGGLKIDHLTDRALQNERLCITLRIVFMPGLWSFPPPSLS